MALNILASSVPTTKPEVARRSANYHPSVWGDKFLASSSPDHLKNDTLTEKHFEQLKEEVKKMLVETVRKPQQQLNLIDQIQRLGVSYQFEPQIEAALQQMSDTYEKYCCSTHVDDLHNIALAFRLLREHGHRVSSDVFHKFMDSNGKLKENLLNDARGLLSLYEASYFRVHGEDILEEALPLTASRLEHLKSQVKYPLDDEIDRALKHPLHKELNRLGARYYISIYEKYDSHNKMLLEFAKLDFNQMQKMYQHELAQLTRWSRDIDYVNKFPYARDRLVEAYFWILGMYFEPEYNNVRIFLNKAFAIITVLDDMYDVYGTYEELLLFTDAIERWETSGLDQLPEYMKKLYQAFLDVYGEMEEKLANQAGCPTYRIEFAKETVKTLARSYLAEARWAKEGCIPAMEEYMSVALESFGCKPTLTNSFVGIGDRATREVFEWVLSSPPIIRAADLIARLGDDIGGHEMEQKKGDAATAVECYTKEHGVTKREAYAEFQKQIDNAWKDMNQASLRPFPVPKTFITRVVHFTRTIHVIYADEDDGYTRSGKSVKGCITSLLVDPVPL